MSGPFDFKGQAIKDSYHRLVQIVSGNLHDGTGSLVIPPSASYAITASYAVSASHEIVKEVSSSYAETASYANNFIVQNDLTASNVSASVYYGDGSNLAGVQSPINYQENTSSNTLALGEGTILGLSNNVIIGDGSSINLTNGYENTIIGAGTNFTGTTKGFVGIGRSAGGASQQDAVLIGNSSTAASAAARYAGVGQGVRMGSRTVAMGWRAGNVNSTYSVFLGHQAGYNETISNRLYIANSNTSTPLIYGEFDNNKILINGELSASSAISASTYYGDGSNLTGIQHTDISALNTFTGSIQTSVNTLTAATSSYNTSTANVTLDTSTLIMTDVSAEITSAESQSIDTTPTSSNAIFYNYVLENYQASGSNRSSRAGNLILINDGTNVNLSDYTVTALGDGDDPYFSASIEDTDTNLYLKDGQSYHFKAVKQHFVAPTSSVILPIAGANVPLLDGHSGAIAAYGLRKLNSSYGGDAIRIREDGSNTETDIGFNVDGGLDTDAISTHCGSNLGHVVTWYDQSGNGRDAEQIYAENQPLIYSGSAVITRPAGRNSSVSLPAIQLGGNNYSFAMSSTASAVGHVFVVMEAFDNWSANPFWGFQGHSNNHHPYTNGRIYENFGTTTRFYFDYPGSTGTTDPHLYTVLTSGSFYNVRFNNDSIFTSSVNTVSFTGNTTWWIGNSRSPSPYNNASWQGWLSEFVMFDTSYYGNENSIESNINSYYQVYHEGLLVDYPGATAAYSVRQLATTYTGDAMNIRRASDNTEQTIGFTSAGDLDTGSIETFCSGTECYVATWYDQSGNGNNATQTSQNGQPLIYRSGSVFTKNNITAIDFSRGTPNEPHWNDNKKKNMQFTLSSTIAQPTTYTMVHDYKSGPGYGKIFGGTNQQMLKSVITAGSYLPTPSPVGTYQVNSVIFSGSNSIRRVNNSQVTSGNPGSDSISGNVLIGGDANSANYWGSGSFQEFILWPSNQSASGDISAIETNINDYFDIY